MRCTNCGFENPDGSQFCNQCGTPLEQAQKRHAERRQITVAFNDLSGFTAMSENMDPEDVQIVMENIFAKATEIIEGYGGRVDKLLGDAVMSVFGDPVAHEDDAERAIRATMELHGAIDELSPTLESRIGRPLQMHSGINTGIVVTSSGSFDTADTGPLGDTINLAARLEDLSVAGEILLGPDTAALVGGVFELADHGSHDLKGKSGPVTVFRVTGFKRDREGSSRKRADFVGRHEEMGILMAAVERVQDGEGSVIGIRAEAGAGKSRLLGEFHVKVRDKVQWLEGRAYAYGENIPYAALVDLISSAVGISEEDSQVSMVEKLRSQVGDLVDDPDRVLDPFLRLYGLPERANAALDKDSFPDRLLESMTAVVNALCHQAPTVLVLQDLHWADPSTIAIFASLIETVETPVVVIASYRPSFTRSFPGLREIELTPLSSRQSGEMVASLLAGGQPPQDLIDFVADRTDGNPFYVEEIINSLIETETLTSESGSWHIAGALEDAGIPSSVRGVIAARIDRLDDDRRRVLREASVVGREFLYDVIRRVASVTDTLDPSLADLTTADLIRQRTQQADLEYFFKHALTQDVAYEGLLRPERVDLHARAAAAIEEQFAGRIEEVTETLAFHYTQGGVLDKAVHYLRSAGRKAVNRYALIEAQAHFETAYGLLRGASQSRGTDEALVDLILDWAILFYYRARLVELYELLDRHEDAVERLNDDARRMWWLIWIGHATGFRLDQSDNMVALDEAIAIAERLDDQTAVAYAKTWKIWGMLVTGDLQGGIEAADEIAQWVSEHRNDDPYPYFKSMVTGAFVRSIAGREDEVRDICRSVIEHGHEVGNNRCIAYGQQGLAFGEVFLGNYTAAIEGAEAASQVAKDPIYVETCHLTIALAAVLAGDTERVRNAVERLRAATAAGIDLPAPLFVPIADAALKMGDGDLTAGMQLLLDTRDEAKQAARVWEWLNAEMLIAVAYARISTGEASANLRALASNPRFIGHIRRARKEAAPRLRELMAQTEAHGFHGLAPIVNIEYAKLLIHNGELQPARELLESTLEAVSGHGAGEGADRIRSLLAQI